MPRLSKSFSPTTIVDGGITTLTFTVVVNEINPLPVIQIFDTLPSGLAYAGSYSVPPGWIVFQTPPPGSNGTIQVDGISIPNGTYELEFAITNLSGQTNPSCDFNPSAFTNQSSNLVLAQITFDGVPSCLVINDLLPLIVTKSFSPSSIIKGGVSTLTITITNPNPFLVAGVAFTDIYPAGVVNANPTNYISGGGVLPPPVAGGNNLTWLKVTGIPAGGTVTIKVDVTSNIVGSYNNMTGAITSIEVPSSAGANAILTVKSKRRGRGGIGAFALPNQICIADNGDLQQKVSYYGYVYTFSRKDERGRLCYIRTNQRM